MKAAVVGVGSSGRSMTTTTATSGWAVWSTGRKKVLLLRGVNAVTVLQAAVLVAWGKSVRRERVEGLWGRCVEMDERLEGGMDDGNFK